MGFCVLRWHCGIEIMASIETVVQNADVEMGDEPKPDSTAEVKDDTGMFIDLFLPLHTPKLISA